MATLDVAALTGDEINTLRLRLLAEQDKRARFEQAPQSIATAVRDAVDVGVDEATIREAVEAALGEVA